MGATEVGVILGSAGYMAPEQARGKVVDRRADIWAFGVILWELLTGKAMFSGENASDVMGEVLTKEPDLGVVPERVRRLLGSCLQKDPRARLKSIGDWRLLVEEERPATAAPPIPARRAWAPWAVAGFLLLVAVWGWVGRSASEPQQLFRVNVMPPEGTTLLQDSMSGTVAISPDGCNVAFITEVEGRRKIWVQALDAPVARPYEGTELAEGLF